MTTDGTGNAEVVWQWHDGVHQRIQERPFSPFASPRPVQTLSRAGEDATSPGIAMDPSATAAIAVWTRDPGGNARIQASTGP